MISFIEALVSLWPYIQKLLDLFISTPEEEKEKFLDDLNSAFKKAKDEKDPTDLSRLINDKL